MEFKQLIDAYRQRVDAYYKEIEKICASHTNEQKKENSAFTQLPDGSHHAGFM